MKRINLFLIVCLLIVSSCDTEREDRKAFEKLDCPIVVKARSVENGYQNGSVVLIDADGDLLTLNGLNKFSRPFVETFKAGDTVLRCCEVDTLK